MDDLLTTDAASVDSSPSSNVSHYTAACRRCGARVSLTGDEVLTSLDEAPICWPCDAARGDQAVNC